MGRSIRCDTQLEYKMIKLKKLIESPDCVFIPKLQYGVEYDAGDAYAFYYIENRLYIANEPGLTHGEIPVNANVKKKFEKTRSLRNENTNPHGRVWIEAEILSFWQYPKDSKVMKGVADDISEHFDLVQGIHVDVWNDFQVEVYDEYFNQYENVPESGLIPVKLYKHSNNPSEEERQRHLLSPAKKKDIEVTPGWGSKKRPADLTATQRHQMKSTSEQKNK